MLRKKNQADKEAPEGLNGSVASETPSQKSSLISSLINKNEPKSAPAVKKEKSSAPYIISISIGEDGINPLNQCIEALGTDVPLTLVLFPTPGLKTPTLKEQLIIADRFKLEVLEDETKVKAQHIYVVPPTKYFSFEKEKLVPVKQPDRQLSPMEVFLDTVVTHEASRSMVLLFTPWIAPYMQGLKRVRASNGLVLQLNYSTHITVETEKAVHALLVDGTLPAREMGERINLFATAVKDNRTSGLSLQQEDIQSLENIYVALHKTTGIRCSDFDLIFILQHIQQRLDVLGKPSITVYSSYINDNPQEIWLLARRLAINVSGFFYERPTMQMIAQDIIPDLMESKDVEIVRAWIPACSTGEDALSLAILLDDYASNLSHKPKIQVIGTEVEEKFLQIARRTQFMQNSMHSIPADFRETYFDPYHDRYLFSRSLLQQVHFAHFDLTHTSPYSNLDLIYYRGHLSKLKKEVQNKVLSNLHASLGPNGYLVIGKDDNIGSDVSIFAPVDGKGTVFKPIKKQKKVARSPHTVNLFRRQDQQPQEIAAPENATPDTSELDKSTPAHINNIPQDSAPALSDNIAQLHRDLLLQLHNPVSLIVKADFSILDQCGNVGLFISWPNNGKTANLLTAFPEEVRADLKEAVQQAISLQKSLKSKVITPPRQGILKAFLLHVRPIDIPGASESVAQVMFIEPDAPQDLATPASSIVKGQPLQVVVNKLESDLRHAKDRLLSLTRQLEESRANTSDAQPELQPKVVQKLQMQNGELKTTNKELLALNRDLVRRIEELRKRTQQAKPAAAPQPEAQQAPSGDANGAISSALSKQILMLTTNRHEIRTALTSIMGFADLLADRVVDADNKELARYIGKAGNRLSDSLSQLLEGDFEEYEVFDQNTPSASMEAELDTTPASDRLLVVEDSDATRRLLSLVLSDRFECELAADANEAIEKAEKEHFKAVLMDINLGAGQSGVDVLQHLRKKDQYQQVPFMAVTAMASPKDESLLRMKGFNAYLAKPFQKSKLLSALDQMLSESM